MTESRRPPRDTLRGLRGGLTIELAGMHGMSGGELGSAVAGLPYGDRATLKGYGWVEGGGSSPWRPLDGFSELTADAARVLEGVEQMYGQVNPENVVIYLDV